MHQIPQFTHLILINLKDCLFLCICVCIFDGLLSILIKRLSGMYNVKANVSQLVSECVCMSDGSVFAYY